MAFPTDLKDDPILGTAAGASADLDTLVAEAGAQYPTVALPVAGTDPDETEAAFDRLILAGLIDP
jgi:hypothetical protein